MNRKDEVSVFRYDKYDVRVLTDEDGNPWFVAADVCRCLGIANVSDALGRLDDDEKSTLVITDSLIKQGISNNNPGTYLNIISESGLYRIVLSSRKKQANSFRRWVTHEVLPSARRTGIYRSDLYSSLRSTPILDTDVGGPVLEGRHSPVGILGPLFDVPRNELEFMGKSLPEIAKQFRAAMQIARDLAGDQGKPTKTRTVDHELEEKIRTTAIHLVRQSTGIDIRLLTTGRPFLLDEYDSDFLSVTNISQRLPGSWTVAEINEILVQQGYQVPGTDSIRWIPTDKGRPYSVYRNVARLGKDIPWLFWRPSIVPILKEIAGKILQAGENTGDAGQSVYSGKERGLDQKKSKDHNDL